MLAILNMLHERLLVDFLRHNREKILVPLALSISHKCVYLKTSLKGDHSITSSYFFFHNIFFVFDDYVSPLACVESTANASHNRSFSSILQEHSEYKFSIYIKLLF